MKKGFTLIELLAVIVILSIIALIAVPIILNIIDSTKDQANKRSIELYGDAIKNAVAEYALKYPEEKDVTYEKLESENLINYDGSKVECETHEIYSDGTIYLEKCKINNKLVEYTFGKKQTIIKRYYGLWLKDEGLTVGGPLPSSLTDDPSTFKRRNSYLGIDTDGSKVVAAYACLKKDDKEYCLKGYDISAYEENKKVLKDAFGEDACTFDGPAFEIYYLSQCAYERLQADIRSYGLVFTDHILGDTMWSCYVDDDGNLYCEEW